MNVIVIGAVQFTLEMLIVIDQMAEVVGVITSDTTSLNSDYADLSPYCFEKSIPFYKTNDVNSNDTLEWVSERKAEVIFCLGWSRLIKQPLLKSAPMGVIGYHPAALPKNRGRHPLIWALVLGLSETASTFFFMDEGADSGDILSQEPIEINKTDDAASLYAKMIKVAQVQLKKILKQLAEGSSVRTPQDATKANHWRKRGVPDGEIDWRMSAQTIHDLVRALTHPYIGAHFMLAGKPYKVWETTVITCGELANIEPGKVINTVSNEVIVKCGDHCLALTDIDPNPGLNEGDYL